MSNLPIIEHYLGKNCPTCGASMKQFWQPLSPGLVKTLVKFKSKVVEKNSNKIHIPKDLQLDHNEYNNFQKLRYHALVAKYKEDGMHIQGIWVLTARGSNFLKGKLPIPKKVLTFRNKVIGYSEELVFVKDVIGKIPYFDSDFDFEIAGADQEQRKFIRDMESQMQIKNARQEALL